MKRNTLQIILTLILFLPILIAARVQNVEILTYGNYNHRWDTIEWNKKIVAGSDSLYSDNVDTMQFKGASDSVWSKTYYAKEKNTVQVFIAGGTTVRIKLKVYVANLGTESAAALVDSEFVHHGNIAVGTGVDNCTLDGACTDSITSEGAYVPVDLELKRGQAFKYLGETTVDGVGFPNMTLKQSCWNE